jgi:hypothetical protein
MSQDRITVQLAQRQDYQFDNQFGDAVPPLLTDEPAPLGAGHRRAEIGRAAWRVRVSHQV